MQNSVWYNFRKIDLAPYPKGSPIFLDSPFRARVENQGKSSKYNFVMCLVKLDK